MPNRIIKESICVSASIDSLSWFEEVLFYRLIVNCDDYGRFDGRVAVVKNRLFPLKGKVSARAVQEGLRKLEAANLVRGYVAEGKPYLYLPTWNDHQNVRAKRSRYPAPEDGENTSDSSCCQMQSDAPGIQSESESNPVFGSEPAGKPAKAAPEAREADFDRFWSAYPRKEGKQKARAAFEKVGVPLQTLLSAIETQKQSTQWNKENGQFIPHPATWLNGRRWEDQLPGTAPMGAMGCPGVAERAAIRRLLAEAAEEREPMAGSAPAEAMEA